MSSFLASYLQLCQKKEVWGQRILSGYHLVINYFDIVLEIYLRASISEEILTLTNSPDLILDYVFYEKC